MIRTPKSALLLALAAATFLAGCGVTGSLDRPAPMWNKEEAQAADARRQAEACQRQIQNNAQRRHCNPSPSSSSAHTITEATVPAPAPSTNQPPGSSTSPAPQ